MGSFLNPGTIEFEEALNSEIYIDKSGLIKELLKREYKDLMCDERGNLKY